MKSDDPVQKQILTRLATYVKWDFIFFYHVTYHRTMLKYVSRYFVNNEHRPASLINLKNLISYRSRRTKNAQSGFPYRRLQIFFFVEMVVTVNILKIKAVMMKTAVVAMAFEIFTNV